MEVEGTYCVFQRSCAFLTFCWAVSAVKSGARDISKAYRVVVNKSNRILSNKSLTWIDG